MSCTSTLALILLRRDEFEFTAGGEHGVLVDEVAVALMSASGSDAKQMRSGARDATARAIEDFEGGGGEDLQVAPGHAHAVRDHGEELIAGPGT